MAVARRLRWRPLLYVAISAAIVGSVAAKNIAQLTVPEVEDAIQVRNRSLSRGIGSCPKDHDTETDFTKDCPIVQQLNIHKRATNPGTSSWVSQIFEQLFPGSPAVNALLATLYISGPPSQRPQRPPTQSPFTNACLVRFPTRPMPP